VKTQLIGMLKREEDRICEAWTDRLSDTALLASKKLIRRPTSTVRLLLHDVVRILENHPPVSHETLSAEEHDRRGPAPDWRISLCQALEVLLTGEVVVRAWSLSHLDATEREQLETFEEINRVFHQLIRLHALHYCENCRSTLPTPER